MSLVLGIDPATRKCGLAIFDPKTKEIFLAVIVESKNSNYIVRTREIVNKICLHLALFDASQDISEVYIEKFAMKGIAGEMLHKFIGACQYGLGERNVAEVRNTTVKKIVGGHGHAEKNEVAIGVLNYFAEDEVSRNHIEQLIVDEKWDITDAFAIAIAGLEQKHAIPN
jgi:Holliday junction resolvasome RuvABC endonuclease subunit